jgi:hypothetical protein
MKGAIIQSNKTPPAMKAETWIFVCLLGLADCSCGKKSDPTPAQELSRRLSNLEQETAREAERRSRFDEAGETQGGEPTPPSF